MTTYVYPRLSEVHALARLALVHDSGQEAFKAIRHMVAYEHDQASPVPTGGPVAAASMLRTVREAVMADVGDMVDSEGLITASLPTYDWHLGRSLYQHLRIVHSDAAHTATWSFLSLMVFPDLVWARFPQPSEERALGGPRNALRRAWRRYELLRELDGQGAETLNEDELVQLTERTSLARNRALVLELARRVIDHRGTGRMLFTRELCKRATFATGPLLVDCLEPIELAQMVDAVASAVPWTPQPSSGAMAFGDTSRYRPSPATALQAPSTGAPETDLRGRDLAANFTARSDLDVEGRGHLGLPVWADVASFVNGMALQTKLERLLCLVYWETRGAAGDVATSRLDQLNRDAGGDSFSAAGSMAQQAVMKGLMVRPRPGYLGLTPAGRGHVESLSTRTRSQE